MLTRNKIPEEMNENSTVKDLSESGMSGWESSNQNDKPASCSVTQLVILVSRKPRSEE